MNVQDAKSLTIPEGSVKMIHDNGNRLLWGAVGYNTKYAGNTTQETTTGKNLVDLVPATNTMPDKTQSATFDTVYEATLGRNVLHASGTASYPYIGFTLPNRLTSGKYYAFMIKYRTLTTTTGEVSSDAKNFRMYPGRNNLYSNNTPTGAERTKDESGANNIRLYDTQTYLTRCIRFYADPDVYDETSTPAWYTGFSISWVPAGVSGNISAKEIWIADIQIYEISQTDWDSNNYTGTDFEKYTGGIPAPNSDYPEIINVVTGVQNVWVHGKNLFDKNGNNIISAYIDVGHQVITSNASNRIIWVPCEPNTNYAITKLPANYQRAIAYTTELPALNVPVYGYYQPSNNWSTATFTTGVDAKYIVVRIWNSAQDSATLEQMLASVQIEKGSTATTYEPYQGATYTVDLGATEFCKIGTYQDYIYKSGDDWYVHKECDSSLLGGFTWTAQNTYNSTTIKKMSTDGLSGVYLPPTNSSSIILAYCTHYKPETESNVNLRNMGLSGRTNGNDIFIYDPDYNTSSSLSDFKTWLSNNSVTLYYVLVTPTDTKITDATLLGQLNAVHEWLTRYGYSATVTGNLPIIIDRTNL